MRAKTKTTKATTAAPRRRAPARPRVSRALQQWRDENIGEDAQAPVFQAPAAPEAPLPATYDLPTTYNKVDSGNGATRSFIAPRHDLVPSTLENRVAARFAMGAKKHGENNWKLAMRDRESARQFLREGYNHAMQHMLNLRNRLASPGDPALDIDDDVAAIGWFVAVATYAERDFGRDIEDI